MNALSKREFAEILKDSNPAQVEAILWSTNEKGVLNILKLQTILKESSPSILIDGKLWKETIAAIKSLKVTPPTAV
jgi:lysozyme family protein